MYYREVNIADKITDMRRELVAVKSAQRAPEADVFLYGYSGVWSSTGLETKYVVFRQDNRALVASVIIYLDLPSTKVIGSVEITSPVGVWAVDVGRLPASNNGWQIVSTVKGVATVETSFPS